MADNKIIKDNPYSKAISSGKEKKSEDETLFNITVSDISKKEEKTDAKPEVKPDNSKNKKSKKKNKSSNNSPSAPAAEDKKEAKVAPAQEKTADKQPVKTEAKTEKSQDGLKKAEIKPISKAEDKKEKSKPSKAEKPELKSASQPSAEEEKPKKKFTAFRKGLLIYSGILVAAGIIALIVLYSFLNAYEHSRPLNCINDYLLEMENGELSENCLAAFAELDENIQSPEESQAYVRELLSEVKPGKSSKLSTPENPAYILTYNKKPLGTVYLKAMEKQPFGFTFWELDHDEFDFTPLINSHSLVLPSDYKVLVNGHELGADYIKEKDIQYKTLESFYEYYSDLPTLVKYESGKYIGPQSLQILDAEGNELSEDELSEARFLNNSSEEEIANVKLFTDDFVSRYVAYAANLNGAWFYNYMYASYLTVPGSQLESRLGQAMGSFGYSTIYSCDIIANDINICYKHGDKYLVDISYITETVARGGPVQQTNNIRLGIVPHEAGFLAELMFNY